MEELSRTLFYYAGNLIQVMTDCANLLTDYAGRLR